jgi:hypothetical protein
MPWPSTFRAPDRGATVPYGPDCVGIDVYGLITYMCPPVGEATEYYLPPESSRNAAGLTRRKKKSPRVAARDGWTS